jgi:hypothetical protein
MTYEDVYEQIRAGDMSFKEFEQWAINSHTESFDEGYQEAIDDERSNY